MLLLRVLLLLLVIAIAIAVSVALAQQTVQPTSNDYFFYPPLGASVTGHERISNADIAELHINPNISSGGFLEVTDCRIGRVIINTSRALDPSTLFVGQLTISRCALESVRLRVEHIPWVNTSRIVDESVAATTQGNVTNSSSSSSPSAVPPPTINITDNVFSLQGCGHGLFLHAAAASSWRPANASSVHVNVANNTIRTQTPCSSDSLTVSGINVNVTHGDAVSVVRNHVDLGFVSALRADGIIVADNSRGGCHVADNRVSVRAATGNGSASATAAAGTAVRSVHGITLLLQRNSTTVSGNTVLLDGVSVSNAVFATLAAVILPPMASAMPTTTILHNNTLEVRDPGRCPHISCSVVMLLGSGNDNSAASSSSLILDSNSLSASRTAGSIGGGLNLVSALAITDAGVEAVLFPTIQLVFGTRAALHLAELQLSANRMVLREQRGCGSAVSLVSMGMLNVTQLVFRENAIDLHFDEDVNSSSSSVGCQGSLLRMTSLPDRIVTTERGLTLDLEIVRPLGIEFAVGLALFSENAVKLRSSAASTNASSLVHFDNANVSSGVFPPPPTAKSSNATTAQSTIQTVSACAAGHRGGFRFTNNAFHDDAQQLRAAILSSSGASRAVSICLDHQPVSILSAGAASVFALAATSSGRGAVSVVNSSLSVACNADRTLPHSNPHDPATTRGVPAQCGIVAATGCLLSARFAGSNVTISVHGAPTVAVVSGGLRTGSAVVVSASNITFLEREFVPDAWATISIVNVPVTTATQISGGSRFHHQVQQQSHRQQLTANQTARIPLHRTLFVYSRQQQEKINNNNNNDDAAAVRVAPPLLDLDDLNVTTLSGSRDLYSLTDLAHVPHALLVTLPVPAVAVGCIMVDGVPAKRSWALFRDLLSALAAASLVLDRLRFVGCPATPTLSRSLTVSEVPDCADFTLVPRVPWSVAMFSQQHAPGAAYSAVDRSYAVAGAVSERSGVAVKFEILLRSSRGTPAPLALGKRFVMGGGTEAPAAGLLQSDQKTHFLLSLTEINNISHDVRVLSDDVARTTPNGVGSTTNFSIVPTVLTVPFSFLPLPSDEDTVLKVNISAALLACVSPPGRGWVPVELPLRHRFFDTVVSAGLLRASRAAASAAAVVSLFAPGSNEISASTLLRFEALLDVFAPCSRGDDRTFLESPLGWVSGKAPRPALRGAIIGNLTVWLMVLGVQVFLAALRMYTHHRDAVRRDLELEFGVVGGMSLLKANKGLRRGILKPQRQAATAKSQTTTKRLSFPDALAQVYCPSLLMIPIGVLMIGSVSSGASLVVGGDGNNDLFIGSIMGVGIHVAVGFVLVLVVGRLVQRDLWLTFIRSKSVSDVPVISSKNLKERLPKECKQCRDSVSAHAKRYDGRLEEEEAAAGESSPSSSPSPRKRRKRNNRNRNNKSPVSTPLVLVPDSPSPPSLSTFHAFSPTSVDSNSSSPHHRNHHRRHHSNQPVSRRRSLLETAGALCANTLCHSSGEWALRAPEDPLLASQPHDALFLKRFGFFFSHFHVTAAAGWLSMPALRWFEALALAVLGGLSNPAGEEPCDPSRTGVLQIVAALVVSAMSVALVRALPHVFRRSSCAAFVVAAQFLQLGVVISGLVANYTISPTQRSDSRSAMVILVLIARFSSVLLAVADVAFVFFAFVFPRLPLLAAYWTHLRHHSRWRKAVVDDEAGPGGVPLAQLMARRKSQLDPEARARVVQQRVLDFVAPVPAAPRSARASPVTWDLQADNFGSTPLSVRRGLNKNIFEEEAVDDGSRSSSPVKRRRHQQQLQKQQPVSMSALSGLGARPETPTRRHRLGALPPLHPGTPRVQQQQQAGRRRQSPLRHVDSLGSSDEDFSDFASSRENSPYLPRAITPRRASPPRSRYDALLDSEDDDDSDLFSSDDGGGDDLVGQDVLREYQRRASMFAML